VRELRLSDADEVRSAYEAKAVAELADADALTGAPAGSWSGPALGARIAFLVGHAAAAKPQALMDERTLDAVTKAAEAFGAGDAIFAAATRTDGAADAAALAARLRLLIEAADPSVVIALDPDAASDLAAAFGLEELRPGAPVHLLGRALGAVGDFAASLDDAGAKTRAWTAMKATAALGGLTAKPRPASATGTATSGKES